MSHFGQRAWRSVVGAALGAWGLAVVLGGGSLLARHLIPLERPAQGEGALSPGLAALRGPGENSLSAFHVLFADCPCSKRVADGLSSTSRPPGVIEHVLLVGADDRTERALLARGFHVRAVAPSELEPRYGVTSAPLLIVATPDGAVVYSGGYTDRKQGLVLRDREIITRALAGRAPPGLPVYGCPVAQRLERDRNPLRLP